MIGRAVDAERELPDCRGLPSRKRRHHDPRGIGEELNITGGTLPAPLLGQGQQTKTAQVKRLEWKILPIRSYGQGRRSLGTGACATVAVTAKPA